MIKLVRGWRVLRVGRGRVIRVLMVVVLLVIAWQTLLSKNGPKTTTKNLPDDKSNSRAPDMQVAAPAQQLPSSAVPSNHQVAAPQRPSSPGEKKELEQHLKDREDALRASDNINPRYNAKPVKDKLQELHPKPVRNQHFLQQNQLNLIDDYQGEDENEDDDYDEDEEDEDEDPHPDGKWNGRNKVDNAEDVAREEEDEDMKEDYELEDVGGEKMKKDDGGIDKKAKVSKKDHKKEEKEEVGGDDDKVVAFGELIGERGNNQDDGGDEHLKQDSHEKDVIIDDIYLDMKAAEKDFSLRRKKVQEVCSKYGLGPHAPAGQKPEVKLPPTPNYDVFYIDKLEKLAWCPIYKAASTSWLYNFLILGGVDEYYIKNSKEQVSHMARRVWPPLEYQDVEEAFKTCLKFMIVRHPFERLVSAYRDKLENTNIGKENGVDHFYQKYGRKIVAKFRKPGQGLPARRYSQDMDDPSIPPPKGIEPTFEEFVKYLIATDLVYYADDHWMPYYLHCTPCLLDYDVLAKFETLDRDQNYIIKKNHIQDKIKPSWKHLTKGLKTSDTVRKYFATITKKDLSDLYKKYKLDFELFDYSVDEYLTYVRDS